MYHFGVKKKNSGFRPGAQSLVSISNHVTSGKLLKLCEFPFLHQTEKITVGLLSRIGRQVCQGLIFAPTKFSINIETAYQPRERKSGLKSESLSDS